ncbi:MAG: putative glycoside hydrolase [Acidimicrobiia bacterium]|nr:putative glycoside hydrolase [Acidimicrobiia bacterium]MDH4305925.1 putative glycoside hydrolase [Acidimicrobiia bacterium]
MDLDDWLAEAESVRSASEHGSVLADAPPEEMERRPRYRVTRRGKVVFTALPVLVVGSILMASGGDEPFTVVGLDDGSLLGAEGVGTLALEVNFEDAPRTGSVKASLDGEDLEIAIPEGATRATITPGPMADGEHELIVTLDQPFPRGSASVSRSFTVDSVPPTLTIAEPTDAVPVSQPVKVVVEVDDPEATVSVGGTAVTTQAGVAELDFERPPRAPIEVKLTDAAGNVATVPVRIPVALPGEPGQAPVRGVHASGWTWATPELRDPILQMIEEGRINTVQLDLKDEGGDIWYDTSVQLAHDIGAVTELWDLQQVVEDLHALDVRVIGRIVNFRDPRLATWAVQQNKMDMIVQTPDGAAYGKYGGFANPYNQDVWEYNIALAEEAAALGVDDIMYDYVRRPDDYLENMLFPGQDRPPEEAIVEFLEQSRTRIRAEGARLGAAVFGIAATRPDEVAQDIPEMSRNVDYIAPMVYPSHWGPGEYGVANPNAQPYDIVYRSMVDFGAQVQGTGAGLMVWVQDFSLGVDYGPAEVRAQIDAAEDAGVDSWLLWDAAATYTAAALDPR